MIHPWFDDGSTYDPSSVVGNTSHLAVLILATCAVSFAGAYLQYFGAISMGFRHRTHSIPLVANLWNFAHDTTYVFQAHRFFTNGFWLSKAFWFALFVFMCGELVVMSQIMRFSREALFPGRNLGGAVASYAVLQVFTFGIFCWLESMIDDPFYYLSFSTTVIIASAFNIQMMRARGSRQGFSEPMLVGYVLLTAGLWPWMFLSDGYFDQPFFYIIAIGNLLVGLESIRVFRSMPAYGPVVANEAVTVP